MVIPAILALSDEAFEEVFQTRTRLEYCVLLEIQQVY